MLVVVGSIPVVRLFFSHSKVMGSNPAGSIFFLNHFILMMFATLEFESFCGFSPRYCRKLIQEQARWSQWRSPSTSLRSPLVTSTSRSL